MPIYIEVDVYVEGVFMERVLLQSGSDLNGIMKEWSVLGIVDVATTPRNMLGDRLPPRPFAEANIIRSTLNDW